METAITVATTASQVTFLGNGATNPFSFNFIWDSSSYINVYYTDANGVITLLSASQYTLSLTAAAVGAIWGIGGTVLYPKSGSPIAAGTSLTVSRIVPLTQTTSISNQGDFYPVVTEQALDTACMQIQQVSARTGAIRGIWQTGIAYSYGDIVQDGGNGGNTDNYYFCANANTSNVWQSDLAAGDWSLAIDVQTIAGYSTSAAASASAAAVSATAASTSAGSSATSATAAAGAASTASTASTNATNSQNAAATSASNANTSAASASSAATSASTSANNAATSATSAGTSESAAAGSATAAATSASSASTSATAAAASASQASGTLIGTSTSSVAVGTGTKTFTTQTGLSIGNGSFVTVANTTATANYMHGQVTSYSGATLIVNVLDIGGTGTLANWTITRSAPQGPGGAGSGTVNTGTAAQFTYYAETGTAVSGNANATISAGAVTFGQAGSVQGSIVLSGSTSGTTAIAAPVAGTGTMTLQAGTDTIVARATTDTLTNKTLTASSNVLGGVTMTLGSDATGDIYYRASTGVLTRLANGGANTILHGSSTVPAYSAVVEADISLTDVTTNNSSSTKHGFAPKSPAAATQFLNGAATPAYAAVKDSDLSTSDVTTNNATTAKHGFLKKLSNSATQFMDGTGNWTTPASGLQPHMTPFVASGTFTTSANITASTVFKFTIVGGGGGGGGAGTASGSHGGGGGGGGATSTYVVSGLSPNTGYTITVGAAGTAGSNSGGNGGDGGTSSAVIGGTTPTAAGGNGGTGSNGDAGYPGGAGGTASNGTINNSGGYGFAGNSVVGVATSFGGNGGSSSQGGGGGGGIYNSSLEASAGQAYGSGGGGATTYGTRTGGAGKAGIVIVEWLE